VFTNPVFSVAVAVSALATGLVVSNPAAADAAGSPSVVSAAGPLTDLRPAVVDPTDGVAARAVAVRAGGRTITVLHLYGFDRALAGTTFGAHVHRGACVAGNGAAAGPHFNITGQPPTAVTEETEIWLDFTVNGGGRGSALSVVPFEIPAGAASSIVIHAMPTDAGGGAGARLACLPVAL
jgi:Cu/Zn superoxide dismutase